MTFSITCSKLTGNPDKKGWAQVHEFRPKDEEKLASRGHLYAVIATKNQQEEIENVVAGRELLARFHEEYFGNLSTTAFNALKDACKKVIQEFSQSLGGVQIAAIAVLGNVVYSASGGGAQVAIFREGMLAKILESNIPKETKESEVVSASGYPKEQDLLILGTSSFFDTFPTGRLKAVLESKDPQSISEILAPTIHSKKESGGLGAVFLKFEKENNLFKKRKISDEIPADVLKKPNKVKVLAGIMKRLSAVGGSLKAGLLSKTSRLPERKIFVKQSTVEIDTVQNRKVAVTAGIILLALLVVSIGFGIQQKKKKTDRERFEPKLTEAKHEYEEAINLFALDPNRARELFIESERKVNQLISEGIDDDELLKLADDLNSARGTILGLYNQDPELFVDLSLLSDGFGGDELVASEDIVYIFDKNSKKVIKITLDTKRSEVVAGPDQITDGQQLAAYSDRVYLLNGNGINEVNEDKERVIEKDWGGEVLLHAYAGNLYVLDKEGSTIWRYTATEDGFAGGQNWFSSGVAPDLSKIISWTVDGSIWLLNNSGKIFKYSLGNQQDFKILGIAPGFVSPKIVFTNENLNNLYVLDSEQKRVVVVSKDGEYQAQYQADKLSQAKGLVVSEEKGIMILLVEDKLYSITIKHL